MPMSEWKTEDLNDAPCGFLVYADNGIIQNLNRTMAVQLGYSDPSELTGKSFESLLGVAGRIFCQTHFFPLVKMQGRAEEIFFLFKTKEREDLPMICNAARKQSGDTYVTHCAFFRAVERGRYEEKLLLARRNAEQALVENKELNEARVLLEENSIELDRRINQLVRINDELAQFSTIVSHDMQESIRKIAVFADKLAQEGKDLLTEVTARDLQRIKKECERSRELASRLELFISLSTHTESFCTVNLDDVFSDALKNANAESKLENFTIKREPLPQLQGDPKQLQLLFYHLLHNSFLYRHPHTPLTLDVKATLIQQNSYKQIKGKYHYTDFVQVIVTDNGTGFTIANKNAFGIHRKHEGGVMALGFGLALCKKIVDLHAGFIELKSFPSRGTTVILHLPLKQ
jgi:sigma-B regulation protein RsbU (phosphoserine phosphatase)